MACVGNCTVFYHTSETFGPITTARVYGSEQALGSSYSRNTLHLPVPSRFQASIIPYVSA